MAEVHGMAFYEEPQEVQLALEGFDGWAVDPNPNRHSFTCKIGGGILKFAEVLFPETSVTELWAQYEARDGIGKGPHFDMYADFAESNHMWFGVYNLRGEASIRATVLPDELTEYYEKNFPVLNEEAYNARREIGALAFRSKDAVTSHGFVSVGTGIVLQLSDEPNYVVHEITPKEDYDFGAYVKLIHPSKSLEDDVLRDAGMVPFDELITKEIGGGAYPENATNKTRSNVHMLDQVPLDPVEARPGRRSVLID